MARLGEPGSYTGIRVGCEVKHHAPCFRTAVAADEAVCDDDHRYDELSFTKTQRGAKLAHAKPPRRVHHVAVAALRTAVAVAGGRSVDCARIARAQGAARLSPSSVT